MHTVCCIAEIITASQTMFSKQLKFETSWVILLRRKLVKGLQIFILFFDIKSKQIGPRKYIYLVRISQSEVEFFIETCSTRLSLFYCTSINIELLCLFMGVSKWWSNLFFTRLDVVFSLFTFRKVIIQKSEI